jgi:hypothetical protein
MRSFTALVAILASALLASSQTTITITPSVTLQEIDGFGVSEAFV